MSEPIEELPPRAFISYTWDSEEHKDRVRNFSDLLREYGIDCIIDQYEISPPEGWTHWAINQVQESDYVLVVYTESFKNLSNKNNVSVANRDFIWQADLVNNILYQMGRNEGGKFIPVVFNEKDKEFISLQLTQFTSYNLNEAENPKGFESLYRHILKESNKPSVKLKTKKAYNKVCPYRGLAPFREEDAQHFFGRERFTEKLIEEVYDKSLVSVIGPSGSGKSSIVYAGLIPFFKEKENALTIKFRPGLDPIMSLSYGVVDAITSAEKRNLSNEDRDRAASDLITEILSGQENLITITHRLSQKYKRPTIIFVDQFEEVITIAHDKEKSKRFLNDLSDLAKESHKLKSIHKQDETNSSEEKYYLNKILLTLRIGFLSTALGNPDTAQLFSDDAENEIYIKKLILGPMSSEELVTSIEKPAIETGLNLEKGLSELIVQAIGQEPGNLPLLEFCLLELWKKQEKVNRGVMTIEDYEELGGVKGALVKHADEVYESLSQVDKEKARRIFIQLVIPGSTDAGTTDTRRITPIGEIGESNFSLLKKLADERLIIATKTSSNATNIEVIHDALIRDWGVLREWMNESRSFRLWQDSIYGVFKIWRDEPIDGNLLKGNKLLEAIEWLSQKSDEISKDQKEFIKSSVEYRDREARAKEEAERKKKKLLVLIAVGSTIFAIFASILSWFSYTKMREVEISKLNSEVLMLGEYYRKKQNYIQSYFEVLRAGFKGYKLSAKYNQERMTILSGLYSFIYNLQDSYTYENPEEHPYAFAREILNLGGHTKEVNVIAFSPNGKILASGSLDKKIHLWDSQFGKKLKTIELQNPENVSSLAFSPDGKILACGFKGGAILLWDIVAGKEMKTIKNNNYTVNSISFHPIESGKIAIGSDDKTIRIWDIDSDKELITFKGHAGSVYSVSFSPDGKMIASGSEDTKIKLWDANTGKELKNFSKHEEIIRDISFSPGGKTLAACSDDNNITLWDVTTGKLLKSLEGHNEGVLSVNFSPNGKLLVSGSADLSIKLWDVNTGKELTTLLGHAGFVNSVAFNSDGETLASGSDDETVRIWHLNEGQKIKTIFEQSNSIFNINFSPDGKILAISAADNSIKLLDVESGKELNTLSGHKLPILSINFSSNSKFLLTGSADNSLKVWDVESGKEIKTFLGHRDYIKTVAFSPNGKLIASGSLDNFIKIWDIESGKEIHTLRGHRNAVWSVEFSPNGKILVSGSEDNTIKIWDIDSGNLIRTLKGHNGIVMSISFSPDGNILASGSDDLSIKLWNLKEGTEIKTLLSHSSYVYSVDFHPDGKTLLSSSGDRSIKLWDIKKGKEIREFTSHKLAVTCVKFNPNGKLFASSSDDGTVKVWNFDIESLLPLACTDLQNQLDHWTENEANNKSYNSSSDSWLSKLYEDNSVDSIKDKCKSIKQKIPNPIGEEYLHLSNARKFPLEESIAHYHKALAINPNFSVAKAELAKIYFEQNKENEAFELEKQKEYLYLYRARKKQLKLNDSKSPVKEEIIGDYKKALEINPKFQPARLELGMLYLEIGNYKDALSYIDTNYAICYLTAKKILESEAQSREKQYLALDYAKKTNELRPNFWENLFLMTKIYVALGEKDNAVKTSSHLMKLVMEEKKALELTSVNDQNVDSIKKKRIADFMKLIENMEKEILAPSTFDSNKISAEQKQVDELFNKVSRKDITSIEPRENLSPDTAAYYYAIAYNTITKHKLGSLDLDLAYQACQKSLELSPNNPYSLNLMVEIYKLKGKSKQAKTLNIEALKYAQDTNDNELIRTIKERKF